MNRLKILFVPLVMVLSACESRNESRYESRFEVSNLVRIGYLKVELGTIKITEAHR